MVSSSKSVLWAYQSSPTRDTSKGVERGQNSATRQGAKTRIKSFHYWHLPIETRWGFTQHRNKIAQTSTLFTTCAEILGFFLAQYLYRTAVIGNREWSTVQLVVEWRVGKTTTLSLTLRGSITLCRHHGSMLQEEKDITYAILWKVICNFSLCMTAGTYYSIIFSWTQ